MRLSTLAFAASILGFCSASSDLEWISDNTTLPKVLICSAGGTILSASNYSRLDNIHYGLGKGPTPQDLIETVPEVLDVAQLAVIQFPATGGSAGLNSSLYLNITQHLNRYLCSPDSDIAFGVDLTFNCSKPFIATGAMRPDTYISPDGRSNFFQAVAAASSPASANRGGLIVFNDRITSIYYSTKTNANTPDTFKALEQGNLGAFLGGQPYYFFDPSYPVGRPHFDVSDTVELPSVIILYGHQGFDASLMYAAVANGAKGLVILGPGAAALSPSANEAAADLFAQGIPTVAVARPVTGTGVPDLYPEAVYVYVTIASCDACATSVYLPSGSYSIPTVTQTLIASKATALAVNSLVPPLEGYSIWEPEWEVEVAPDTTIVARGTIEQVRSQLSKINPSWEADSKAKREAATADGVELTKRTDFITDGRVDCGGRWERTRWERIHDGIEYLRGVPGQPTNGPGPGTCGRVSCSYGGAIWWCNDNTTPKNLAGYGSIADGAQAIMDKCRYYEAGGRYWVSGQAFHKTGWNVVVRHDEDNC